MMVVLARRRRRMLGTAGALVAAARLQADLIMMMMRGAGAICPQNQGRQNKYERRRTTRRTWFIRGSFCGSSSAFVFVCIVYVWCGGEWCVVNVMNHPLVEQINLLLGCQEGGRPILLDHHHNISQNKNMQSKRKRDRNSPALAALIVPPLFVD